MILDVGMGGGGVGQAAWPTYAGQAGQPAWNRLWWARASNGGNRSDGRPYVQSCVKPCAVLWLGVDGKGKGRGNGVKAACASYGPLGHGL